MPHEVVAVEPLQGTTLMLTFRGGERRTLDLSSVLDFEGIFEPLRDPAYFRSVRVDPEAGTITWRNGADVCPDTLYDSSQSVSSGAA